MSLPDVDGVFEIEQFHIHLGSEHTLEGNEADFELHGVHKLESGTGKHTNFPQIQNTQAVLGIWIQATADSDNAMFTPLLEGFKSYQAEVLASDACTAIARNDGARNLEISSESIRSLQDVFDVYALIPSDTTGYAFYDGSLTTPPCTENVWWTVANTPLTISATQGDELRELILDHRNATSCEQATGASPLDNTTSRDPQNLNGRTTILYCTGDDPNDSASFNLSFMTLGVWIGMAIAEAIMMF